MKSFGNLSKIRIGVSLNPSNTEAPAFRRRFGHYLKCRGLRWELADYSKKYDIVLVHHSADLTRWKSYEKGKIVFDYNDDYLAGNINGVKGLGRGLAKFVSRRWSNLVLNYQTVYKEMMRRSDTIVCCTEAQRVQALALSSNVHMILDMQSDPNWKIKEQYIAGSPFNLVWEGLPNFEGLESIEKVIEKVLAKNRCALHLVTALMRFRYLGTHGRTSTKDEVMSKLPFNNVWLYEWNKILFTDIVNACDLGIIPINMNDPFWVGKPANKLLFFWRMGMPVLVSGTPAYKEIMTECGVDMICESEDEWLTKLDLYINDSDARRVAGKKGLAFVSEKYSEERQLNQWDQVLYSVV